MNTCACKRCLVLGANKVNLTSSILERYSNETHSDACMFSNLHIKRKEPQIEKTGEFVDGRIEQLDERRSTGRISRQFSVEKPPCFVVFHHQPTDKVI